MSTAVLGLGILLVLFGYTLARPASLAAGGYLGGTVALLMLGIFAPAIEGCATILSVAGMGALIFGLICTLNRSVLLAVLGLIAGELIGRLLYKTVLQDLGVPVSGGYFFLGFFALLAAVLATQVGCLFVTICTALLGSYLCVGVLTEMVLVPYVDQGYLEFLVFSPLGMSLESMDRDIEQLSATHYLYVPLIAVLLLALFGSATQWRAQQRRRQQELPEDHPDKHLIGK